MNLLLLFVVAGGCIFCLRFLWAMHQELKRLRSIPETSKAGRNRRIDARPYIRWSHGDVLHSFDRLRVRVRPVALRRTP